MSWYIESQYSIAAGLYLAARWNEIRFNDLPLDGSRVPWDDDVRRIQLGAGYRILHNTGLRAEYVWNRTQHRDPKDNLFAVQWWYAF